MTRISKTLIAAGTLGLAAMVAAPAAMAEQGDWILKGGATMVSPESGNLVLGDIGEIPEVGVVTDASLEVDDGTSFGFTITYMVSDNIGIELLAAYPFKHDIDLSARINGQGGSVKIAETEHLPPTLSVQYHFMPDQTFNPYIGVGVNWTMFSGEKIDPLLGDNLSLDDSFGLAAQIGVDFNINEKWLLNADIRYIQIETDAKLDGAKLGTVEINPLVYSLMVGYKF